MQWKPLKGMVFGKLTVLEDIRDKYHMCKCECSCPEHTIKIIRACHLMSGATVDCGCGTHERLSKSSTKHGLKGTTIYKRWSTMRRRCYDKNYPEYENYGGRGIEVCDDWKDDACKFAEDMLESFIKHVTLHGERNTTLDRIDVNKNYCKENCRWATLQEQALNRTNTHIYEFNGKSYNIAELASLFRESNKHLLRGRLKNNNYNTKYVYEHWYAGRGK